MLVALAQITSGRDLTANLELVEQQVAAAAASGAQLVVFPEATMRAFGHSLGDIAQPLDGAWISAIRHIAERHHVTIAAGVFTPATDQERVRNTMVVCGGGIDEYYDKIHLFDAMGFRESRTVEAGDHARLVTINGIRVGLAICYDVRFPQLFQRLARAGAQAVVLIASWQNGPGKIEQWETLVRARAMDAGVWMLACDQGVGVDDEGTSAPTGVGHSMVVGPDGQVRRQLAEAPGMLLWDLDVSDVADYRKQVPVLDNAREFSIS